LWSIPGYGNLFGFKNTRWVGVCSDRVLGKNLSYLFHFPSVHVVLNCNRIWLWSISGNSNFFGLKNTVLSANRTILFLDTLFDMMGGVLRVKELSLTLFMKLTRQWTNRSVHRGGLPDDCESLESTLPLPLLSRPLPDRIHPRVRTVLLAPYVPRSSCESALFNSVFEWF
jgi:hypothetical protein